MKRFEWLVICLLAPPLAGGCGGKKTEPEVAAPATEPASAKITAEMPDDPNAKSFAKALVATEVTGHEPTEGDGISLVYRSLKFKPDGTWNAQAVVKAGFEEMACQETGNWMIDGVDSATTATMQWTLVKTTCAARDAGAVQRIKMTILKEGQYKIAFR